jgi:hypothetical protein
VLNVITVSCILLPNISIGLSHATSHHEAFCP